LKIDASGSASAGLTIVDIETAPIPPNGTRTYEPAYLDFGSNQVYETQYRVDAPNWKTATATWTPPSGANSALVFYFCSSICTLAGGWPGGSGEHINFPRAYIGNLLSVSAGTFLSNNQAYFGTSMNHNASMIYSADLAYGANPYTSTRPTTKIDVLTFTPNTPITFTVKVDILRAQWVRADVGLGRVIVLPFIDKKGQDEQLGLPAVRALRANLPTTLLPGEFDPSTVTLESAADRKKADASVLKSVIQEYLNRIDSTVRYIDDHPTLGMNSSKVALLGYRDELYDLRKLPGTFAVLSSETKRIGDAITAIVDYTFRFEI
jgi:hypothetical protein